jgi:hypothetical protein
LPVILTELSQVAPAERDEERLDVLRPDSVRRDGRDDIGAFRRHNVTRDDCMERQVDLARSQCGHLARARPIKLGFQTTDCYWRDAEPAGNLGSLLASLARPSDQQGSVNRSHTQTSNILDEELLYLLVICELVVDDDRWDGPDAEQAAGKRPALPFYEEVVASSVRSASHSDGRENTELLDRPAKLTVPLAVTLPPKAMLWTDPGNRDLLHLRRVEALRSPDAHFDTPRPVTSYRIGSRSRCPAHTHHP